MNQPQDPRENSGEQEQGRPVFELAISREEIYADSRPVSVVQDPPAPAAPSPAAPAAPPAPSSPAPAPEAAPALPPASSGMLVGRRRKTLLERLREHPAAGPSVGALLSLAAGFVVALWLSSSSLQSDVRPLVTAQAILEKSPPASRDHEKIAGLQRRMAEKRSSIAWKTGGAWVLVSGIAFFAWNRFVR